MRACRFVALALRRLRARLGLTLLSLLGVTLAVGMVGSIPIFTQAVSYLVLRQELQALSDISGRPPFAVRFYYTSSSEHPLTMNNVRELEHTISAEVSRRVGLPVRDLTTSIESFYLRMRPAGGEPFKISNDEIGRVRMGVWPQLEQHIDIVEGEPFGELRRDGRVGLWAHAGLADEMGLHVGEKYDFRPASSDTVIAGYIAGTWRASNPREPYWFDAPDVTLHNLLMVPPGLYETDIVPQLPEGAGFVSWYLTLDEGALAMERAESCARGLESASNHMPVLLPGIKMDYSPLEPLNRFLVRKAALSTLLLGFSVPALGLLLYFLSLISSVTALFQREDTAVFAGRGATPGFSLGLVLIETSVLIVVGTPLGILLAGVIARLMGYSYSFLLFVNRPPLPTSLLGLDPRLLGAALLSLLVARLLPAWQATRISIVGHLRARSRPAGVNLFSRLAVDVPLALAAGYAYQHLRLRGSLALIGWEAQGDPFRDPLLLLAPTLFVATACLLLAHVFPLVVRPLEGLSARVRSFPLYMGLHDLSRQSGQYTNALFLALTCLSLGTFYSSLALSLDGWLRDRIYYAAGADLTFQQGVAPGASLDGAPSGNGGQAEVEGGWLLPASDYLEISGVTAATRIGDYSATASPAKRGAGRFVGVDRLDFPSVAYFRDDFAAAALGELMNRIGMYENGILVSRSFLTENNLSEGQTLTLEVKLPSYDLQKVPFRIVGAFDSFPTLFPKKGEVFVGNLEYLFEATGGVHRHQIWLRTDPAAGVRAILERVEGMGVYVAKTVDARVLILQDEERVERVGLFGVLTIGFLSGSILSVIGLLVYTYASLQGRLQQLSVHRAIGASLRDVLSTVAIEYGGVIVYGVAGGIAVGLLAAFMFVPFFQFGNDPALALPSLLVRIDWPRIGWIAAVFAAAMGLAQTVMLYRLTRRDVFQVLRMGQRE